MCLLLHQHLPGCHDERGSFACFDGEATGAIQEGDLRGLLTTTGARFTDGEVDELFREVPIHKKGTSATRLSIRFVMCLALETWSQQHVVPAQGTVGGGGFGFQYLALSTKMTSTLGLGFLLDCRNWS